ncbi:hypothetical protein GUITHDRAFT_145913 [Guillardia theta CCMP2712]|uniref:Fungal lipase-type domain-containing protein n=1 Tax=Guillardia theta (strain CCMP2712) TaxID=905079 RepID=L1IJY0_GUITC|nr:hypothetical protein GUITHDRAFT_145913 [Guillardia theta CCMP2712]EKX36229.1 hypothetical protein GUITHDRAFT_145913 [Guillardia theta CCMP2712]|eukprot:XP_005823209.1 hypothetical protein GUITHDRAFT_145913 [Guillardia theta CCMP2712]
MMFVEGDQMERTNSGDSIISKHNSSSNSVNELLTNNFASPVPDLSSLSYVDFDVRTFFREFDPISSACWMTAGLFEIFFIRIPDLLCDFLPYCGSVVSGAALYIFAQTLALLWGFLAIAVAVLCTKTVNHIENCWFDHQLTSSTCAEPVWRILVFVYIYYCVMDIFWILAKSLFEVGWEMYGDFPGARILLNPKIYFHEVFGEEKRQEQEPSKDGSARALLGRVQYKCLLIPLLVIFIVSVLLSALQICADVFCREKESPWILELLARPSSRLSRTLRFTLFIGLLQWAQTFHAIFPRWYRTLNKLRGAAVLKSFFIFVGIPSGARLMEWTLHPGEPSRIFPGLSHTTIDNILVIAWTGIFLFASSEILRLPLKDLKEAGLQKEMFKDSKLWCRQTLRFKFMLVSCEVLHFIRGVLSARMGFTFSQNDLILISLEYPILLVVIWVSVYCSLVLSYHDLALVSLTPVLSSLGSKLLGVEAWGIVVFVTLHLEGFLVDRTASSSKLIQGFRKSRLLFDSQQHSASAATEPRMANGYERKLGGQIAHVFLLIALGFWCFLAMLGILSAIQVDQGWFPANAFIALDKVSDNSTKIFHDFGTLTLSKRLSPGPHASYVGLPEYAICNNEFWGMRAIDYGLLSLAAYFGPKELLLSSSLQVDAVLSAFFPQQSCTSLHDKKLEDAFDTCRNSKLPRHVDQHEGVDPSQKFWTEVVFEERNLTVISVRGTEFWRLSDWLEDVRMWTEPAVFTLLSNVFPTINIWSPQATAMSLLKAIGLPDSEYKYNRLVRHIRHRVLPRTPPGHQVVLTGHSLGGGIAHVVAALLNLPAVAFNPPGVYKSLAKHLHWHGEERRQMLHAAHNRTVTVLAENDFIGRLFDSHAGLVQTITCSTDQMGPLGCHMIENAVCNLLRHCNNDPRWQTCWYSYDMQPLKKGLTPSLKGLREKLQMLAERVREKSRAGNLSVMVEMLLTLVAILATISLSLRLVFMSVLDVKITSNLDLPKQPH